MSEHKQKMVFIVTNGFNDERSSVAWSVANGGEILVYPPCAEVRGHAAEDLIDSVTLAGQRRRRSMSDPEKLAQVGHHLGHCRSCYSRQELESLLTQRLRSSTETTAPAVLQDRLRALMERL